MKEDIVKIEITKYEGDVYNLEVEPFHETKDDQFYLDDDTGIVIHNCHPRDNIAMSWLAKKLNLSHNFFEDIMKAREDQSEFLVDLILEHNGPYYILGKTFKEETNLTIGSPAILLKNILEERGINAIHYDPFVDDVDINFEKGTYFVATRHNYFKNFKFPKESTVIDVWRFLEFSEEDKINHIRVGGKKS
jgi:UDPglucose 6-dehydrogenase